MIVTFCGHADFCETATYETQVLSFLEEHIGDRPSQMYLGGYGNFDEFLYRCCKKYKSMHPNTSLILVTPYLTNKNLDYDHKKYDCILYPELETVPLRYAISHRNRYMVNEADYVIAYIAHDWGGAYTTYKYAKSKGKPIFNLADLASQR